MLVHSNSQDGIGLPVGIAISEWVVDGKKRVFVLYPISYWLSNTNSDETVHKNFVEIGCATEEDGGVKTITPATKDWGAINNGFGDNAQGYVYDEKTKIDIYKVWDDGAKTHMQEAKRLFVTFGNLIKYYDGDAWKYLEEQFEPILKLSKSYGWEPESLNYPLDFPYELER